MSLRFGRYGSFLFAPAGDDGGGGGGTEEENKSGGMSAEEVARIANAAVKDQLGRFQKSLPQTFAEVLAGLKLDEKFSALETKLTTPKPADDGGGSGGGDKGGGKGASKNPELEAFQRQIAELASKLETEQKKSADLEKARLDTEQKRLFDNGFAEFRNLLRTANVRPELLEVAASHWGKVEGRLKVDENGQPLLRVKKPPFKGSPELIDEEVPLAEGIEVLLKSQEAKPFLPAPSGGQQQKGGNGSQSRLAALGPDASDASKAHQALEALKNVGIDPTTAFD